MTEIPRDGEELSDEAADRIWRRLQEGTDTTLRLVEPGLHEMSAANEAVAIRRAKGLPMTEGFLQSLVESAEEPHIDPF